MQDDCLIAIRFFLYLEKCLIKHIKLKMKGFLRTPKYVDVIAHAGTSKQQNNESEKKLEAVVQRCSVE